MSAAASTIASTSPSPATTPTAQPRARARRLSREAWADLGAISAYVAMAVFVFIRLWLDPNGRFPLRGNLDPAQFQWFITHGTKAILSGHNPLYTHALNAPEGVNLMGNTSILGLVVPLIPVTLLFGSGVTYALILSAGLAGTAIGWYWVFVREFGVTRWSGLVAGAFCGFAPPVVAHANAHVNFTVLFLFPFIVRAVLRMRDPQRWRRNAVVLGLLVTWQVFIGEEILLFCAFGLLVVCLAYAAMRPRQARAALRPMLCGLTLGGGIALVLLAYPLWYQFFGPRHWTELHAPSVSNDVMAMTAYAMDSVGRQPGAQVVKTLATNPTEQNGFFGWALFPLLLAITAFLWRDLAARLCAVVTALFLLFSLGKNLEFAGHETRIPGLWWPLSHVPLLDSIMPGRLTLVAVPAMGMLLALGMDRVRREARLRPDLAVGIRVTWVAFLAAALLPLAPKPLVVQAVPPVPAFFTGDTWKRYVEPGRTLVAFPTGWPTWLVHPMWWQIASDLEWNAAGGYFVGPHGADGHGDFGAETRPTTQMVWDALFTNTPIPVDEPTRAKVRADLTYWKADAVVLVPQYNDWMVRSALEGLIGPGQQVAGVWVWDVRSLAR